METTNNYRPMHIEFDVAHDGSEMPETFGEFTTDKDMLQFVNDNLVAVPYPITVARHMDNYEKNQLRKEYNNILENIMPTLEKRLSNANIEYEEAKKKLKDAQELVNSEFTKSKELAREVKRGLVEMNLDEQFTYRVAFRGRYYIYTYIDKEFKLCKIKDIPESEKTEIWNSMTKNEEFVNLYFSKQAQPELEAAEPRSEFINPTYKDNEQNETMSEQA